LNQKFQKHFASLPERQKEAAIMTAEGLSQEKIASRLSVNVRTVQRDLKSLKENPQLKEIHEHLKGEGYGEHNFEPSPHKWVKTKRKIRMIKCPHCGVWVPFNESSPDCPYCHEEIATQ
jgi:adenine-specific DNA methylase